MDAGTTWGIVGTLISVVSITLNYLQWRRSRQARWTVVVGLYKHDWTIQNREARVATDVRVLVDRRYAWHTPENAVPSYVSTPSTIGPYQGGVLMGSADVMDPRTLFTSMWAGRKPDRKDRRRARWATVQWVGDNGKRKRQRVRLF